MVLSNMMELLGAQKPTMHSTLPAVGVILARCVRHLWECGKEVSLCKRNQGSKHDVRDRWKACDENELLSSP